MKKIFMKLLSIGLVITIMILNFSACSKQMEKTTNNYIQPDNSISLMNYENAETLLDNPDRGLRMETYITLGDPLYSYPLSEEDPFERVKSIIEKYKSDSPTLCQVYVYLSNYSNCELDDLAFEQLEKYFKLFRENGIRMLLRFAYSTESVDDAPYEIVSIHINQLKEWFGKHSDLINDILYCLQTGIIGYWGEGHSYNNFKKRDIKKVISDVCELAPEGIYTQVRTYDMLKLVSDENMSKVGIHDDYIIGDMSHKWSFIPNSKTKKFNKTISHAKLTINDGEMPWGGQTLNDEKGNMSLDSLSGKEILNQLQTYSMTSFSLEHNYREDNNKYSMAKWQNEYLSFNETQKLGITVNPQLFKDADGNEIKVSVYDIIRYHLGYQLVLSNLSENQDKISFAVTNYGFAAPLNFNYFALICRDKSSGKLIEQEIFDYDKTELQSGTSTIYNINLPDNCDAIGVKLETFKGRSICVRFANATKFENGVQYFK
ncbi:MAG: DUF4874 domain-containing protein [Eubacterium sp.]